MPWAFELVVLFSSLLLLGYALPEPARLVSISPHPFWLPVLLLSVQYGTGGGLAAAFTAVAVSWLIGWPAQAGNEDFYDYTRRISSEPILWLGAAVVLGGLRGRQQHTLAAVRQQLTVGDAQRQSIGELCNTLKSHCEDLERRMACARDYSIDAGLTVLTDLRNSEPCNLPSSLRAAVDLLFGPAHYAVLLYGERRLGDRFTLNSIDGRLGNTEGIIRLSPDLEDALVNGRRHLSIFHDDDVDLLDGTALFAAPIVSEACGRVLGAFLIQSMDAAHMRPELDYSMRAICRELACARIKDEVVTAFANDRFVGQEVQYSSGEKLSTLRADCDAKPAAAAQPVRFAAPGVGSANALTFAKNPRIR